MRILVAYGTKRGGNEGLARAVATGLVAAGHAVDVIAAAKVDALDRWDAVVVGGAPYAWFWQRDARRFVKRNVEDLFESQVPPLMLQLMTTVPPPPPQLNMWAAQGPRPVPDPDPDPEPEPEPEPDEVPPAAITREQAPLMVHRLVLWSCFFTGLMAVAGGASLLMGAGGFDRFLLPALMLVLWVGGGNLVAAVLEARRVEHSELVASVAGASLMGWLLIDLVVLRSFSWVQVLALALGLCTVFGSVWLWRARTSGPGTRFGLKT